MEGLKLLKVDRIKKKPEFRGIRWLWTKKDDWPNDRLHGGPIWSTAKDSQKERVFLSKKRLKYIFDHGQLIFDHHGDPSQPVVPLGPCLAMGVDKLGKAVAIWGVPEGSETVDMCWNEMQRYGKGGGYSIGGKYLPGNTICKDDHCERWDPDVTEVSWTPTPSNKECPVYYINQMAKSCIKWSKENGDTFELEKNGRILEQRLAERFLLDPYYNIDDLRHAYPCMDNYVMGLCETGLLQKSEAYVVAQDKLETIKEKVLEMVKNTTMKKEDVAPGSNPTQEQNPALAVLNRIAQQQEEMLSLLRQQKGTATEEVATPPDEAPGVEPPMDKEEEQTDEQPEKEPDPEPSSEPEPEKEEGKDKKEDEKEKKKGEGMEKSDEGYITDKDGDTEPEGPNPDMGGEKPDERETEDMIPPESDTEPEGPNPDISEPRDDKGDAEDDRDVTPEDPGPDEGNVDTDIPEEEMGDKGATGGPMTKGEVITTGRFRFIAQKNDPEWMKKHLGDQGVTVERKVRVAQRDNRPVSPMTTVPDQPDHVKMEKTDHKKGLTLKDVQERYGNGIPVRMK